MADIKLFVACHQPSEIPKHPLLVPVQVGAALADRHFDGYLHDDAGDNISAKNRSYCELTAQYWAWKNAEADYYGFFHYRRYLFPNQEEKLPYIVAGMPTAKLLDKLGYGNFETLIRQYDLIAPKAENMFVPVREHYANAPFHHGKDLTLVEDILRRMHPEYVPAMEKYLLGTLCYFGNIYIMSKAVFHDYCSWLFPVLEEFNRQADLTGYSPQELRVDGYLAERLFGIWLTNVRSNLRAIELPRVHFDAMNALPDYKKRLLFYLFPPGTGRRCFAKKVAQYAWQHVALARRKQETKAF